MDFRYIVETKEEYNEKHLKENHKNVLNGIRWVREDIIDTFLANYEVTEERDDMSTLDKIKSEIVTEAMEELKKWIESDEYEFIVKTLDSYED